MKMSATVAVEEDRSLTAKSTIVKEFKAVAITNFDEPLIPHLSQKIPNVGPDEVLIKNSVVGLNPIDWKAKKYRFGIYDFPWVSGRESSGVVVTQGDGKKDLLGKRVFITSTSYRDIRTSTFQEYTLMKKKLVWELPEFLTVEDGATIGVGLVTSAVLLSNCFRLDLSKGAPEGVLVIWGGGTVIGIYTAQIAKQLGLTVVSISSPKTADYLKNVIGVDLVLDRSKELDQLKTELYEYLRQENKLHLGIKYGVDCYSKESSYKLIEVLKDKNNKLNTLPQFVGVVARPKDVEGVEVIELVIKKFHEDLDYGSQIVSQTSELLRKKKISPVRYKLYKGGLEAILKGLEDLEVIGASAEKYIVDIRE